MPLVTITMLKGRKTGERKAIMNAVHKALVDSFRIPDHDRIQRLIELERDNFDIPPGKSEAYTIVEIKAFQGRPVDAKRALYQSVIHYMGELGIDPLDVFIIINDLPRENWGIRGGQAACDVELGFTVEI